MISLRSRVERRDSLCSRVVRRDARAVGVAFQIPGAQHLPSEASPIPERSESREKSGFGKRENGLKHQIPGAQRL